MDASNEELQIESLKNTILVLGEELDELRTQQLLTRVKDPIDYHDSDFRKDVVKVKTALQVQKIADLRALYRKPFFSTLQRNYTRAVFATACIELAEAQQKQPEALWVELKETKGTLGEDDV